MFLKETLITIGTSTTVTGLLIFIAQTWMKKGVTHHYDKKVQELNHYYNKQMALFSEEINVKAEQRKLEFDRKIHDFSIYSSKKHELYPELFKIVSKISYDYSHINSIVYPLLDSSVINSKEDIVPFLKEIATKINSDPLTNLIQDNKFLKRVKNVLNQVENLEEILQKVDRRDYSAFLLPIMLRNELLSKLNEDALIFERFIMENELYFSEEISIIVKKLLLNLNSLIYERELTDDQINSDRWVIYLDRLREEFDETTMSLKQLLKKELSIGDYSRKSK